MVICRTEQEACSKGTSFNDHDQLSARATHTAPVGTTRRIRGRVSHSGRGQRGGQIRDQTEITEDNSNSRNRGRHRGKDISIPGVVAEEWLFTVVPVFRMGSGCADSKAFLEGCGMRNERDCDGANRWMQPFTRSNLSLR